MKKFIHQKKFKNTPKREDKKPANNQCSIKVYIRYFFLFLNITRMLQKKKNLLERQCNISNLLYVFFLHKWERNTFDHILCDVEKILLLDADLWHSAPGFQTKSIKNIWDEMRCEEKKPWMDTISFIVFYNIAVFNEMIKNIFC